MAQREDGGPDWTPPADRGILDAFEPDPAWHDAFGAPLYAHHVPPEGQE